MTTRPERIGPYPIERELGRGGMGIVYLARDPKLHRLVAIKVLPDAFAGDPERLARFEREARLLASLNHPNIAAIHGLEESAGHRFLVLEYVEGETLADRLKRGALPVSETLDVGRQIAAALEAAHESGVIHRDLKPGNVKLTPGGEVKVLDFGLAKAGSVESGPDLTQSPTIAYHTGAGVILGTAAYMSPEQARGKSVDRRTDIWSLGVVLYECLTGRQLFSGETVSDMIARILEREPDWNALPAQTPEKVRELLRRMLDKDAKKRQRDIGDARIELEGALAARSSSSGIAAAKGVSARSALGRRGAFAAGAFVALAAAFLMGALLTPGMLRRTPDPRVTRFSISDPPGALMIQDAAESAISPDGRQLAFLAADSAGTTHIWVRSLDALAARPLAGTTNCLLPFWSPDGRWIAFFADGKLKKTQVSTGGTVEVLCDAKNPRGGTWNRRDVIVFAPDGAGPLFQVSASGGDVEQVTTIDSTKQESAHRFPVFLPDGKRFLYVSLPPRKGKYDVWAGSLDSRERRLVMMAPGRPTYVNPGYLIYLRGSGLVAQGFDLGRLRLQGKPIPVPDRPAFSQYNGYPAVSASDAGDLAYLNGTAQNTELTWIDRTGHERGVVRIPEGSYQLARPSLDGRFAAVVRFEGPSESDVWLVDLERSVATRFTFGPGLTEFPLWSPDGERIAYQSSRSGPPDFFVKSTNGTSPETVLYSSPVAVKNLYQWSPDGRSITFEQLDGQNGWDLYVLDADGKSPPRPYLRTSHNERWGAISPDGRWMAYASDETGQLEIYVQSYPEPTGTKYRVSMAGGSVPVWRSDGRELAFLSADLLTVLSSDVSSGSPFRAGMPKALFRFPPGAGIGFPTHDLQRFLVPLPAGERSAASITVALNGTAGLAKR